MRQFFSLSRVVLHRSRVSSAVLVLKSILLSFLYFIFCFVSPPKKFCTNIKRKIICICPTQRRIKSCNGFLFDRPFAKKACSHRTTTQKANELNIMMGLENDLCFDLLAFFSTLLSFCNSIIMLASAHSYSPSPRFPITSEE